MQINRLFETVYILLENKTVTAAQLAQRFEVSQRTVYRDIEALSEAGIPIYMSKGRGGGISLLPNFILNKAVLTEKEKADILSSLKAVSAVDISQSGETLGKLDSMLGSSGSDWIEVDFSAWGNSESEAENFGLLKSAILEKRAAVFLYASVKGEKLERKVYPLKLVFKGQSWYMYGYCKTRKDYRFFKLRRIDGLEITDETFDMEAPEKVIVKSTSYGGMTVRARFRVSPEMAFRIYDEVSDYTIDADGSFIFDSDLPDINTICGYAGSFGEFCEILAPDEARIEMKRRLEKMMKSYI